MVAVPHENTFKLLIRPYIETITFAALGAAVPDRGSKETLLIAGLEYDLRVTDAETNQPLHIENGMWLIWDKDQTPGGPSIARHATIPHVNINTLVKQ